MLFELSDAFHEVGGILVGVLEDGDESKFVPEPDVGSNRIEVTFDEIGQIAVAKSLVSGWARRRRALIAHFSRSRSRISKALLAPPSAKQCHDAGGSHVSCRAHLRGDRGHTGSPHLLEEVVRKGLIEYYQCPLFTALRRVWFEEVDIPDTVDIARSGRSSCWRRGGWR